VTDGNAGTTTADGRPADRRHHRRGSGPTGVAVSPAGPDAGDSYIGNNGSNNVSVITP
jgi:DNA-binding beta-propeller fold protein YncE